MQTWKPNLCKKPPTQEEIDRMAEGAGKAAKAAERTALRWKISSMAVFTLAILLFAAGLWHMSKSGNADEVYQYGIVSLLIFSVVTAIVSAIEDALPAGLIEASVAAMVSLLLTKMMVFGFSNHVIALWTVVCAFAAVPFGLWIISPYKASVTKPLREAERLASDLSPMDPKHCPEMLDWCRRDETLAAYQGAIAKEGRLITAMEHEAAKEWIESAKVRAEEEAREREIQAACRTLREPVLRTQ